MNSLDWSKTYEVLSISRLYLRDALGISTERVLRLTDEDMQRIAAILQTQYFDHEYDEDVRFVTRTVLAEKGGKHGQSDDSH